MRKFCPQVVVENFFEPCVLFLLMKKPSYGYELNKMLKESCDCQVNIGNLYRGLNRLVKDKYITKKNILALDIGAFFVVIAIAQVTGTQFLKELSAGWLTIAISIFFLIVILISFLIFTRHPPKEPDLFLDPVTSEYGLKGHGHK